MQGASGFAASLEEGGREEEEEEEVLLLLLPEPSASYQPNPKPSPLTDRVASNLNLASNAWLMME